MPSNPELREWVKAFIKCFNMDKVTVKKALELGSEKFGIDLKKEKNN